MECIFFVSDVNSNCFVRAIEIFFKKLNIIVIEGVREEVELELGKRKVCLKKSGNLKKMRMANWYFKFLAEKSEFFP